MAHKASGIGDSILLLELLAAEAFSIGALFSEL